MKCLERIKVSNMDVKDFDYYLDESLIAQSPLKDRPTCRLMLVNREDNSIEDKHFYDILDYLKPGDVLVRNDTKVIPARLFGVKDETGAHVEVLILKQLEDDIYECLCGNAKAIKVGSTIIFKENVLTATCLKVLDEGIRHLKFHYHGIFLEVLEEVGETPLPPYIHQKEQEEGAYQTVYAKHSGSSAAPTAGFHFDDNLFKKCEEKGVIIVDITLHIGLGTFRPVKVSKVEEHKMHSEQYEISESAAKILNLALKEHRRIIPIGTTSMRTLEANYKKYGCFVSTKEATDIFITPGFKPFVSNALITNFHLPKSTLLMLVSAFSSLELMKKAYVHATEEKYRFFSFGDAMFIYG